MCEALTSKTEVKLKHKKTYLSYPLRSLLERKKNFRILFGGAKHRRFHYPPYLGYIALGYVYTGPVQNGSGPILIGLLFTRDRSGTGPERIQNWTCCFAGPVSDQIRTGSRKVPCFIEPIREHLVRTACYLDYFVMYCEAREIFDRKI